MIRGIVFDLVVWAAVSFFLYQFWHLTGKDKLSVGKSIAYGLFTAVITAVVISIIVAVF